jgi:methyl-accepting chemotaxis protein
VVATEVRALAQRSADAALDIKKLISESSEQVERGVTLVGQTGETFERIVNRVGEIAGLASGIAAGSQPGQQYPANSRDRARSDLMTQQNAAMVEQATAAARSLAGEADRMANLVSHFRLEAQSSAPRKALAARAGLPEGEGRAPPGSGAQAGARTAPTGLRWHLPVLILGVFAPFRD